MIWCTYARSCGSLAWATDQARPARSSPTRATGLDPAPLKKDKNYRDRRPSRPKFLWAEVVFDKTYPNAPFLLISLLIILISSQIDLLGYQKILNKFEDLFRFIYGSLTFFFYDFIEYLDCKLLLWNMNLVWDIYYSFSFSLKKIIIRYVLFSIQIFLIYSLASESWIPYFSGYVIFINARVGSIHSRILTRTRVMNIISKPSKTK